MEPIGEAGLLASAVEWMNSPVGHPGQWPANLRTSLSIILHSPVPMYLWWGEQLVQFYNEAYCQVFRKHSTYPDPLGRTAGECPPEIWAYHQPDVKRLFAEGVSLQYDEQMVPVILNGETINVNWTLAYSPVKNEEGFVDGMLLVCHENTQQFSAFRNLVEQAPDPILILKGDNFILEVANSALFDLWKVGPEAIGKPLLDILPEMKHQAFPALLQDVYHNGIMHEGYETPVLFRRSEGHEETLFLNFVYQPFREADGSISGVIVMATDVTAKVLASRKAFESENNFQKVILQAPVGICIVEGEELKVEIANNNFLLLNNRNREEVIGRRLADLFPEMVTAPIKQHLSEVIKLGKPYRSHEEELSFSKGEKRVPAYIDFVFEPLEARAGSENRIMILANDVTDRVLARKKIEVAEERARLAIDSAELGTMEINLLTNQLILSPRFNSLYGFTHTLERIKYISAIHHDDLALRENAYREAFKTGRLEYESRVFWPDNTVHWIRIKGKVFFDKEGLPMNILGVAQDITEQKLFAQQLAKQVDERTRALKEANQRLELSNAELEQFAYIASHDLQEPIRKIRIFNSMLLDRIELGDEAKRYAEKVAESSERITGLINDLLEYSRLAKGSIRFDKVDLNSILKHVLSDYELMIRQKKAIVDNDPLPCIEAVSLQMNQLFYNLVGNALKFAKKDVPPVLTIRARSVGDEERNMFPQLRPQIEYYKISFHDNGIGFNQEYAQKIFIIFQRLNERSMYGGYGIGLALCKKITDSHKGVIYAEGLPRKGAVFTIILPAVQQ